MLKLEELYLYPIKSCKGIKVSELTITERGAEFDRHWMLVDTNGKFITQRQFPKMSLIQTSIEYNGLMISFGNHEYKIKSSSNEEKQIQVWKSEFNASICTGEWNEALSDFLQTKCQLVEYIESSPRKETQARFHDSQAILLVNLESLADLNSKLKEKITVERFRPNIVVSGLPAFSEDQLKTITLGEVEFEVVKPCSRCVIVNVDPNLGQTESGEVLKTIAGYRKVGNSINFGVLLRGRKAFFKLD